MVDESSGEKQRTVALHDYPGEPRLATAASLPHDAKSIILFNYLFFFLYWFTFRIRIII